MLRINTLAFGYGGNHILTDVTLQVQQGEIVTLIGASGTGKSTLLRLIAGLIVPTKGLLEREGEVGLMMQQDLLLPWRTIFENITLTSELGGGSPNIAEAARLLSEVGLAGYEERYPHELSGGMRQRVSLARALLEHRSLLLLDEPFASLDVAWREKMYSLLRMMRSRYNLTILMVTHDFRDALSLSDRIILLDQGMIVKDWVLPPSLHHDAGVFSEYYSSLREACLASMA